MFPSFAIISRTNTKQSGIPICCTVTASATSTPRVASSSADGVSSTVTSAASAAGVAGEKGVSAIAAAQGTSRRQSVRAPVASQKKEDVDDFFKKLLVSNPNSTKK